MSTYLRFIATRHNNHQVDVSSVAKYKIQKQTLWLMIIMIEAISITVFTKYENFGLT